MAWLVSFVSLVCQGYFIWLNIRKNVTEYIFFDKRALWAWADGALIGVAVIAGKILQIVIITIR